MGDRIRELRGAAGFTQAQLAERLGAGVAVETVSRFERGVLVPSLPTIERIAHVLGTDVDGLLRGVVAAVPPDVQRALDMLAPLAPEAQSRAVRLLAVHLEAPTAKPSEGEHGVTKPTP